MEGVSWKMGGRLAFQKPERPLLSAEYRLPGCGVKQFTKSGTCFTRDRRVMVQGLHGPGKSPHIEQVAARFHWPCVRLNLDGHISRAPSTRILAIHDFRHETGSLQERACFSSLGRLVYSPGLFRARQRACE